MFNFYDGLLKQEKNIQLCKENQLKSGEETKEVSSIVINLSRALNDSSKEVVLLQKNAETMTRVVEKNKAKAEKEFLQKFRSKLYEEFGHIFTKNMIDMILDENYAKHWKDEDYAKAISIFNISSSCYNYLRDQLNFPLPCRSSIYKILSNIPINRGLIVPVWKLLKEEFQYFTPLQRAAVMCFDEVGIDSRLSYNVSSDQVWGPFKNMMAITIRSLYYKWKQLVYVEFDDRLTKEKILYIISCMSECGVNIVAINSDMSTLNRRVWNELDLDIVEGKYYFDHPSTKKPIWTFADFPHLIKLLRNHFLDHPIKLGPDFNNAVISVKVIKELLNKQNNSDLKLTFKISEKHLNMNKRERMNVRTAMELFSETTSKAIKFLLPEHSDMANFFLMVNDAVDILNTRTVECSFDHKKCPYGKHLDEQSALLRKFSKNMMELRVQNSRPCLLPFQKGVKLTCGSLCGLFRQIQQPPINAKYIMTNHLNQDHLESAFGVFRGIGRYNDHPMPSDALTRVKNMIISENLRCPKTGNVHAENGMEFMSSGRLSLLQQKKIPSPTPEFEQDIYYKFQNIKLNNFMLPFSETGPEKAQVGASEFVAGYLARQLIERHPAMAQDLSSLGNSVGWVKFVSRGHLVTPSQLWLSIFLKMDEFFEAFHRSQYTDKWDICTEPGVTSKLIFYITRALPYIPDVAVTLFVKLRTKIRITTINKKIVRSRRDKKVKQFMDSLIVDGHLEQDEESIEEVSHNLNEQEVLFALEDVNEEEELLDI